jgi:hypothetical protein
VAVAGTGIVVATGVALYVNGPWRKRIVDEITMRDSVQDEATKAALTELIERATKRYATRRRNKYWGRRLVVAAGILSAMASGAAIPIIAGDIVVTAALSVASSLVAVLAAVSQALSETGRSFWTGLAQEFRALGRGLLADYIRVARTFRWLFRRQRQGSELTDTTPPPSESPADPPST